jgi:hypothetical protein
MLFRSDPGRIVERACGDGPDPRDGFESEPDVGSATGAELLIQPSTGFVGKVPVGSQRITGQLHVLRSEDRLDAKSGWCSDRP